MLGVTQEEERFTCSFVLKRRTKRVGMEGLLFLCHISPKETETTSSLSVSTNANAQCVANKSGISTLICQVGLKETHLPEPQKQELHWEPVRFFF